MPWTNRFSKDECKTAKDVNWSKIASMAKVDVPPMVLTSFNKKVAKEKSFDIKVDVDSDAQKGRVVLKFPSGKKDDTIEFSTVDPEVAKKVRTARKVIDGEFAITRKAFKDLSDVKVDYKKHKADLAAYAKLISSGKLKFLARSGLNRKIFSLEKAIVKSMEKATKIEKDHDSWYILGPRKGKAKYIKEAGIEEKKLSSDDRDFFDRVLFDLSNECNKIKTGYKKDIFPALETLTHKAAAVRATLTKSEKQAIKEVERHLITEMAEFSKTSKVAIGEFKADKSQNFVSDLNDSKKGPRIVNNLKNAHIWKSYWDSNQGRLSSVPELKSSIEKNAKRMKKIVPKGMEDTGNIPKLNSNIDVIVAKLLTAIDRDKAILESEQNALQAYKPA